jgi:hypothetical protein
MVTISWAVTACNEYIELKRLLEQIESIKHDNDEIVLQLDVKYTSEVEKIAKSYNPIITALKGDFANFKNILKKHCTKDYIVFLDADELMGNNLALNIHEVLTLNSEVECFALSRINTVEGLTQEHIQKWGWIIDNENHINYPDYQLRVCKNIPEIKWEGKVHERLVGQKNVVPLEGKEWALLHPKTIDRQERQNNYYATL